MAQAAITTSAAGARASTKGHIAFGKRLKAARLAADISQGALGKLLGVTFQQVQKYEKGTNRMDVQRVIKAAKLLNIPTTDLMGINDDGEVSEELSAAEQIMSTREGVQVIRAMIDLNQKQRQFLVDVARRLPKLNEADDE